MGIFQFAIRNNSCYLTADKTVDNIKEDIQEVFPRFNIKITKNDSIKKTAGGKIFLYKNL
jgi:hypothetical protein